MAVVYDDDIAPAIESKAAKGRIIYDTPASAPPPVAAPVAAPAVSGAGVSPPVNVSTPVGRNPRMSTNTGSGPSAPVGELAQAAGSGFNSGVLDVAGLPIDALHGAVNVGRRLIGMSPATDTPVGGSESLKNLVRNTLGTSAVDANPASNGQDLSAIHTVGGLVTPGEAVKAAGVGGKVAEAVSNSVKPAEVVQGAAKPSVAAPLETARGAGYVARPSDARAAGDSPPGLIREALTSSAGLAKKANLQNQALTTRLAGEHIGVKGATRLTDADYDKYRSAVPGPTYDATAQALNMVQKDGKLPADADTVSSLNSIATNPNPANAIPSKAAANVQRIAKKIESGNYTGDAWRTDTSWLRANGARDAASELEDMAERHLAASGQTPQIDAFRNARQQFAQSYDLQGATAQRGQVDAQHLAALDAKYPGLLTGNLKLIATAGRTLPDVTKVPGGGVSDLASNAGHGPTGVINGAAQVAGGVISKLPGMNVLAPKFQTANFGRKMTADEASYVPSFGKQGPGASPFAPRMDLTPPPGERNAAPQQLGMTLAQGRPAAPALDLAPAPGQIGEAPAPQQLGMTLAQGRPMDEQRLNLKPTDGSYDPYQHSLPLKDNARPKAKPKNKAD